MTRLPSRGALAPSIFTTPASTQGEHPGSREGQGDVTEFFFPLPGASPRKQEADYLRRWTGYRGHTEKNLPGPNQRIFRIQFKIPSRLWIAEVGKPLRSHHQGPVVAIFPYLADDPDPGLIGRDLTS